MTTYNSTVVAAGLSAPTHGAYGDLKCYTASVTTTAAPSTSDALNILTLPKNSILWGFECKATQMDSNGSPTLSWNIGDAGSATRLFSAVTVGRTSTPQWQNETSSTATHSGVGYQFPADTTIIAVPQANPATGVAGTLTLNVYYTLQGGAS